MILYWNFISKIILYTILSNVLFSQEINNPIVKEMYLPINAVIILVKRDDTWSIKSFKDFWINIFSSQFNISSDASNIALITNVFFFSFILPPLSTIIVVAIIFVIIETPQIWRSSVTHTNSISTNIISLGPLKSVLWVARILYPPDYEDISFLIISIIEREIQQIELFVLSKFLVLLLNGR